jgi:Immunity protein 49
MSLALESYYQAKMATEREMLEQIAQRNDNHWEGILRGFWSYNQAFGVASFFLEKNPAKARQHFYLCARLEEASVRYFNSRVFDYGINRMCYAILSDNLPFLRCFAEARYKGDGKNFPDMDIMVERGEEAIFCHSIQMILKEDWETLARNLRIMETKVLIKKKNKDLEVDYRIYKGILERKQDQVEEALLQLLAPKVHKKRRDNELFGQYVSNPALGYAKLAWQRGLPVVVDSPLVPKELLPVEPLEKYEDTYDFLKRF